MFQQWNLTAGWRKSYSSTHNEVYFYLVIEVKTRFTFSKDLISCLHQVVTHDSSTHITAALSVSQVIYCDWLLQGNSLDTQIHSAFCGSTVIYTIFPLKHEQYWNP